MWLELPLAKFHQTKLIPPMLALSKPTRMLLTEKLLAQQLSDH
jgi:hypothetical protein